MIQIKGKVNTAICYASVIGDEAIAQLQRMCDYEFVRDAKIRIMPDVHAGSGCTIGTTMTIRDKVVPNIVGVDIGCGMYVAKLGNIDIDFEALDAAVHQVPSGMDVWETCPEPFELSELRCERYLKDRTRLLNSLGTLGGGNHFVEVDTALDGTKYLIIHSGSRGLGRQVANYYQKLAVDLNCGRVEEYPKKREDIINTYKALGQQTEIEAELLRLKEEYQERTPDVPEDLCFLYGRYLDDYLHDVEICQHFAKCSREIMAEVILQYTGLTAHSSFHTIHNYINTEEMILRKGAIAAHEDELVLIPINMRDGCILARGKGNPEWNYSAPHGAGRLLSRSQAKEQLDLETYKKSMEGIFTTSVNMDTLDEAPMAYKSLKDIVDVIHDTVDIIEVLKPIYNFKSSNT